ncbi:MAG: glycosyltransferase family 2 protein [Steroidobacteraceae bacterium]
MAKVTVIIPTFNRAVLLAQAIDSALRQTLRDVEIVVVDDGSTDETPEIARQYGDRVIYQRQPNRGVNAARNAAVARSTGEFVALLDSDDVFLPHALELLTGLLARFPRSGFAYADFLILRGDSPPFGPGLRSWHGPGFTWDSVFGTCHRFRDLGLLAPDGIPAGDFSVYTGDIYAASLYGPQVPTSSSLIRRSLMGDLLFPESDSLCGDWEFFARLSHRHGAVYADIPAMLNRSHEDEVRLTRVDSAIQLERRIDLIDRVWRQDATFLSHHASSVNRRQFALMQALARNRLLAGDSACARSVLARAAPIRAGQQPLPWFALRIASLLPGVAPLLRFARVVRGWFWRIRQ